MREIGTVSNARDGERLRDYLLTLGIRSRVDPQPDKAAVWVYDEDQRDRARGELERFLANPTDPRYEQAAIAARELERQAQIDEKRYRKNVIDVRSRWDAGGAARRPVTFLLIGISIAVAVVSQFGKNAATNPWTQELFITQPVEVDGKLVGFLATLDRTLHDQWWRLVTPIFLHFGVMHLLFNMFVMVDLGTQVELRRGSWRMLLLVLAIAVASNLTQFFWSGPQFGGLSGVAYGLFGYIWMQSRFAPASGFFLHPNTVLLMMVWFVLCFFPQIIGNVANAAHAGGLACGVLLGLAPVVWSRLQRL